jgi:hypothetical protein
VNFAESEPLYAGALQLYAAHRHTFASRAFEDFRPVPNREGLFTVTHQLGIGANYAIPRSIPGDWTLSLVIPLIWREFRTVADDRIITDRVRGVGDISFGARMRYLWWVPGDDSKRGASFSLALITDFPTGQTGAHTEGKEVPRELQLGQGAFGLTLVHIGAWSSNRLEFISTTSFTWHSIGVGRSNYDFGDEFHKDFEVKYRVVEEKFPGNTMFIAAAVGLTRTDFDRDDGRRVTNTGGWRLSINPKLQYHPKPWWELKAVFEVPIWRDGHGIQLVEELSFRFSVAWKFST